MVAALGEVGNASSVHAEGRAARARIEAARSAVARLVGGDAKLVTFTSGGTEANNTVLTPDWRVGGKPVELSALLVGRDRASVGAAPAAASRRMRCGPSRSTATGVVDLAALRGDARQGCGAAPHWCR